MNKLFWLVLLILSLAACDQIAPAVPSPIPPPVETATLPPSPLPPSPIPSPTALKLPFIQGRLSLRDLVGTGRGPVAAVALGTKQYVANSETNNVAVLQDNRVATFIPVGKRPTALAADTEGRRIYVANYDDKTVSLIIDDKVSLTENIAGSSWSLVFQDNHLFVGLDWDSRILVLDPTTLKTQSILQSPGLTLGVNLRGDPVRHHLYLDLYDKIGIVDSATLQALATISTKGYMTAIIPDPLNRRIIATVHESGANSYSLIAYDTASGREVGRVKIGAAPGDGILSMDGERVYVANTDTHDVTVVDLRRMSVHATIPVGMTPRALLQDATLPRIYVVNEDSDNVSVIDTSALRVNWTIPLGMFPTALVASEASNRIYVSNASTDSVYAVQGNKVVKEIGVGHHPVDLAVDSAGKRVFVADAADGTISMIGDTDDSVRISQLITRPLTTVAVDTAHSRLFAGGVSLDLKTLLPSGTLIVQQGYNRITPTQIRLSPTGNTIYALGWNGGNGTNSGTGIYTIDANTLETRGLMGYGGSTTAFALDAQSNRIFVAITQSVTGSSSLVVYDSDGKSQKSIALGGVTTGMLYNPDTHHLFVSHGARHPNAANPIENQVEILDGTTLGVVTKLKIDSPGRLARLGNTVYVASQLDGSLTLIQDMVTETPAAPTPTLTPSPLPTRVSPTATLTATFTPTISATATLTGTKSVTATVAATRTVTLTATRTITPTRTVTATTTISATRTITPTAAAQKPTPRPTACIQTVGAPFAARLTHDLLTELGCALENVRNVRAATQTFERGIMFWVQEIKTIYVLYFDGTWQSFDDTWTEGSLDDACPDVTVPSGMYKPKRGFGQVWCAQAGVRARLGSATTNEVGPFTVPLQRFERGIVFTRDGGQVLILTADGQWR